MRKTRLITVAATAITSFAVVAPAASTWIGATNGNWNEPTNWSPAGVPADFTALVFPDSNRPSMTQNIGAGFAPGAISFTTISTNYTIGGSTISLVDTSVTATNQFATLPPSHFFSGPVSISGPVTLNINDPSSDQLVSRLSFRNISGPGTLIVEGGAHGIVTIGTATLSGPAFVNSGMLRVGGWATSAFNEFMIGSFSAQQDVTVGANGTLAGFGTLALAAGKKVQLNGTMSPGYGALPPDNSLLGFNGDVVFGAGARYVAELPGPGQEDRIVVNGLLDLSATGDQLVAFVPQFFNPAQYVVAQYQNRLGQFDVLGGNLADPRVRVVFTSAPNSGPGQIIIIVPEPSSSACLLAVTGLALRRRIRFGRV